FAAGVVELDPLAVGVGQDGGVLHELGEAHARGGDPVDLDGDAHLAVAPARDIRVERPELEGDGGELAGGDDERQRVSRRQLGRDGLAARRALEAPALEQLYAVAALGQRARENVSLRLVVSLLSAL